MRIAVYPRLGDVLDAKNVTVPELKRRIEERFDLSVDLETLYSLSLDDEPIRHVDIRVAEAVAAVLDVPLDDLFACRMAPIPSRKRSRSSMSRTADA